MKNYTTLLFDIDGTILDFLAAEKAAIRSLFLRFGFGDCDDAMISRYSQINTKYWQALERNEMTKKEILVQRFIEFFSQEGLDVSKAVEFNDAYQYALGDTIVFCDDAYSLLKELKQNYILVAVTNGTRIAQKKKLSRSGLDQVFDHIFISEEIGAEKPNIEFFNTVRSALHIDDFSQALLIGDSLTSDIRGGINAGIDTCWYNPAKKYNTSVPVTYEISNLQDLRKILVS